MIEQSRREYLLIRINAKSKPMPSGCVEWQGTKNAGGYGLIHFAKAPKEGYHACTTAHRALYMAFHNVILRRNQVVCHKCDNPACVNIEHLFVGSHKDNVQDMLAKDRNAKKRKPHTRHRKYTKEQIKTIKECIGDWGSLARSMGMSWSHAYKIRKGQRKQYIEPNN